MSTALMPARSDHAAGPIVDRGRVTILVPAYNEEASVGDTVESLLRQTVVPAQVLVIDDGSTDRTAEVAAAAGATVVRPPIGTGSKAGAQTFALDHVRTDLVLAIDADTTLEDDALERLLPALDDPDVAAVCGFVLPRHVRTMWERGRYVEYLFAFSFFKQVQDYYKAPLISSGCFSLYRTKVVRSVGGWPTRTLAEDMDLTWTLYQMGWRVRFEPAAMSYPIEPHDATLMRKQLRRWSHGFVQNIRLHWRRILPLGYLPAAVTIAVWDAFVASLAFLVLLPLLAVLVSPWFLAGFVLDLPAVLVPVAVTAARRGELWRAMTSLPAFYVLRVANAVMMLEALATEVVLGRRFDVYEKGH